MQIVDRRTSVCRLQVSRSGGCPSQIHLLVLVVHDSIVRKARPAYAWEQVCAVGEHFLTNALTSDQSHAWSGGNRRNAITPGMRFVGSAVNAGLAIDSVSVDSSLLGGKEGHQHCSAARLNPGRFTPAPRASDIVLRNQQLVRNI